MRRWPRKGGQRQGSRYFLPTLISTFFSIKLRSSKPRKLRSKCRRTRVPDDTPHRLLHLLPKRNRIPEQHRTLIRQGKTSTPSVGGIGADRDQATALKWL